MTGRHPLRMRTFASVTLGALIALLALTACGSSSTGGTTNTTPIKIGFTVSLTGDFSADGQAFLQGYSMWRNAINKSGGLLGREVDLKYYDDASNADQVTADYQKLITVDKVDLLFGPFSTALTKPASVVANRYGYALVEGAGGGPSVFTRGLNDIFDVSLPVDAALVNFCQWLIAMPNHSTLTAAYATEDDPFTQPQVDKARALLEAGGVKTASYDVYPAETTDFAPIAQKLIHSNAQVIVTGTLLNDIAAFINAFKQQNFNPQALIATAGPDQGSQFVSAIGGTQFTEGVFVPNGGWYPTLNTPGNQAMVQAYLAGYGGQAADISADVPEAYSVGQVMQQAVTKINSLDNAKLIQQLHSGTTYQSVQGDVKFDSTGQNTAAVAYLFQWVHGTLIPVYPAAIAQAQPEFPKPNWP